MDEPTDEQRERVYEWLRAHPYGDQDENGIDLSLLRANLKLTIEERWQKHQRAMRCILEVKRAGERARLRSNTRTAA